MRFVRSLLSAAAIAVPAAIAPIDAAAGPAGRLFPPPGPPVDDCATWDPVPPHPNLPPLRRGHAAVLDARRQRMLVFGGNPTPDYGELLAFSLNGAPAWTKLEVEGPGPSTRLQSSVVLDTRRDRLIVFGGRSWPGAVRGDAWALPLDGPLRWVPLEPAGIAPVARAGHSAVYDEAGDRMIVHGGFDAEAVNLLDDVWALSLGASPAWSRLLPQGEAPTARQGHAAVYDRRRGTMVVFGGVGTGFGEMSDELRDVWSLSLDATPRWTRTRPPEPKPPARAYASVGHDEAGDRLLLYGGTSWRDDAWELSLADHAWSPIGTPGAPSGRAEAAAVFDPVRRRLVLYGGEVYGVGITNEAWELATHPRFAWARVSPPVPAEAPGPLLGAPATVAPERRTMFLLGNRGEAWSLLLKEHARWELVAPSGSARMASGLLRGSHDVVWDPRDRRLLTFDGVYAWALAVDAKPPAWTRLARLVDELPLRDRESIVLDPFEHRLLLFGGAIPTPIESVLPSNALWALPLAEGGVWERIEPAGEAPAPSYGHGAVVDAARRRMLVAARTGCGTRGCAGPRELWEFALDGSRTWRKLRALGPDEPLLTTTMVLDAAGDRVLDVDAIDRPDPTVSVLSLGDLSTRTLLPGGTPAARRDLPAIAFDPGRRELLVFGGSEFFDLWRIVLGPCGDAPRRAAWLEAAGAAPAAQPALGVRWSWSAAGRVRFVVTAGDGPAPVRLEVLDVAGRRRLSADVPAVAGSPWSGELAGVGKLPAGVYLVRVVQGDSSVRTKLVLAR